MSLWAGPGWILGSGPVDSHLQDETPESLSRNQTAGCYRQKVRMEAMMVQKLCCLPTATPSSGSVPSHSDRLELRTGERPFSICASSCTGSEEPSGVCKRGFRIKYSVLSSNTFRVQNLLVTVIDASYFLQNGIPQEFTLGPFYLQFISIISGQMLLFVSMSF